MERKIGEIFEFKKDWYQCVEGRCKDCHFSEKRFLCKQFITKDFCTHGIIFKKLEKVGEPYEKRVSDGTFSKFQRYKVYNSVVLPKEPYIYCNFIDGTVEIEIKQNKEDMEEKKLNLKPFDIQKAREGKPVCTRDGRKARIICFDAKDTQPIIGLYEKNIDGIVREYLCSYHTDGRMYDDQDTGYDLMMLPEKKEGWTNVYNSLGVITFSHNPFDSKEEALAAEVESPNKYYVDTIKISWEE